MGKFFSILIRVYQLTLSPIFSSMGGGCRFYPSCSEYSRQMYMRTGWWKATASSLWRVLRCNPFSTGGVDRVK